MIDPTTQIICDKMFAMRMKNKAAYRKIRRDRIHKFFPDIDQADVERCIDQGIEQGTFKASSIQEDNGTTSPAIQIGSDYMRIRMIKNYTIREIGA